MRIFHLLYLVTLFYFSGWIKKYLSCCPMKFKTYKLDKKYLSCSPMKFKTHKVFWCFLLRIMAALFACCFQVAFLFSSSPFSRPIFYPFLFKAFKGYQALAPLPVWGHVLYWQRIEEKASVETFFKKAPTLSQQEMVVSEMPRRDDIRFRPKMGKRSPAGWQPVETVPPNG